MKKKVPSEYRAEYRKIKRILSAIKKTGTWHKTSDMNTVFILEKNGHIKYIGKKDKIYKITEKGNTFLKRLNKLLR